MGYLSEYQYYENSGISPTDANFGEYQYVGLLDIVNNYKLMYTGNQELVNNVDDYKIMFHAKRAIQELNYDAFKEIKALELEVADSLRFVLPRDYVNYVRISLIQEGILLPLSQNTQILGATSYMQLANGRLDFSESISGQDLTAERSNLGLAEGARVFSTGQGSDAMYSNVNPQFDIDKASGVINFTSAMSGETCLIEYISDGMEGGDESLITVNKMFEDYIYAAISYSILDSKLGVQEYVVHRARKKKTALLRNARIRISDINPGRLLQTLRSQGNTIK